MSKINHNEIEFLISEYLREELLSKGYNWKLNKNLDKLVSINLTKRKKIVYCIRTLSELARSNFKDQFQQMCSKLNNLENLNYELFKNLADELFKNKYNWSNIIFLLIFSLELILTTIDEFPSRTQIDNIHYFISKYLSDNLLNFMNENNGWEGLIEYCNQNNLDETFIEKLSRQINFIINNQIVRLSFLTILGYLIFYFVIKKK